MAGNLKSSHKNYLCILEATKYAVCFGYLLKVSKLSTLVAVLCKKMRYYFPSKSVTLELPRKHPIIH